jgi:pimeloyl-ACP methyl ester carboxylesterase
MEWLILVAAVVIGVPAAAWFAQDRLIFHPQPVDARTQLPPGTEPIAITANDGTRLHGWLRPAGRSPAPAVLYFGGNAEEISWTLADRRWPREWAVAGINYRGYGHSQGTPSEAALVADAKLAFDALAARPEVDKARIVAFGRSLGAGVAVKLAAERPVAAVILASPYDSLVAVGETHYRWLPVRWLLRHRFELLPIAREARAPLLTLVSEHDRIVPRERSLALHEAWAGPKTWQVVPGTDHNTLGSADDFWGAVAEFLERTQASPR